MPTEHYHYIGFCRTCWHTHRGDVRLSVCRHRLPNGSICQGRVVMEENPKWLKAVGARVPVVADKPSPSSGRAGTRLTDGAKIAIYGPGANGIACQHGTLDMAKRLYQCGGEAGNFIYRRLQLVSMALVVWERIQMDCNRLEFIDHMQNQCYAIRTYCCRLHPGQRYDAGIGPRIGWPIDWFEISDAAGVVLTPGNPPREEAHVDS
jgi:hypothetical protein